MKEKRCEEDYLNGKKNPFSNQVVRREVGAIYTKGTYSKEGMLTEETLDTKYVLVFLFDESTLSFGFTFFDLSTLQFHLGQFTDDSMLSKFRTLVARVRPVEVVCSSRLKTSAPACVLRAWPQPPAFSLLHPETVLGARDAEGVIEHYLAGRKVPEAVAEAVSDYNGGRMAVAALGMWMEYLASLLLAERTVALAEFHTYHHDQGFGVNNRLLMDAQAMKHLEVFEVEANNKLTTSGSLYELLNRWSTKFGSRLLRGWIQAPLYNENKLKERIDAVEWLTNKKEVIEKWKKKMTGIPDLERWLARVYKFSVESDSKAIYINRNLMFRLHEFYLLITEFEKIVSKLLSIFPVKYNNHSSRLDSLTYVSFKFSQRFFELNSYFPFSAY